MGSSYFKQEKEDDICKVKLCKVTFLWDSPIALGHLEKDIVKHVKPLLDPALVNFLTGPLPNVQKKCLIQRQALF